MSQKNQKLVFVDSDESRSERTAKSIMAVFVFSLLTTTSFSINSLMQAVFGTYVKNPRKRVWANFIWVIINISLISLLVLGVYKDKVLQL
jgi:hypothetical protein